MTTTVAHLHRVLQEIDAHLEAAPHGLPVISIRDGRVWIETTALDLPGIIAAFHMAEPVAQPCAISTGEDHVIVLFSADCVYDGQPWRVAAPMPVSHARYREIVAESVRAHAAV